MLSISQKLTVAHDRARKVYDAEFNSLMACGSEERAARAWAHQVAADALTIQIDLVFADDIVTDEDILLDFPELSDEFDA